MIFNAWFIVNEYHLNLGTADNLERVVIRLKYAFEKCMDKHLNDSNAEFSKSLEDIMPLFINWPNVLALKWDFPRLKRYWEKHFIFSAFRYRPHATVKTKDL